MACDCEGVSFLMNATCCDHRPESICSLSSLHVLILAYITQLHPAPISLAPDPFNMIFAPVLQVSSIPGHNSRHQDMSGTPK